MAEYEPGRRNIGPAERTRRRHVGYVGFLAGAVVVVAVPVLGLDPLWLLASAAPFYGGFLGAIQARSGFCAGFGLAGIYDVSESGNARTEVEDAADRNADRKKSLVLQLEAIGLAMLLTGAIYAVGAALA